nr:amino acid adenylation domain-containing protein [Kroppenstedtia pulmonis]
MAEALKRVKEQMRQIPQKGVDYGILRYLSPDSGVFVQPQPSISFNYLGQFDQGSSTNTLFAEPEPSGFDHDREARRAHLIDVVGVVARGKLQLTWLYSRHQFAQSTIQGIAEEMRVALQKLIAHCTSETAFGYTPSDFPLAILNQKQLDRMTQNNRDIESIYPLSPLQQGMLFHTLFDDDNSGDYISQTVITFKGEFQEEEFERAWKQVVSRHPVLRTTFDWEDPDSIHQIVHASVSVSIERQDWCKWSSEEQEARLEDLLHKDRIQGFDLKDLPLMRWYLLHCGEQTYRFIWSHHHVLLDGWSMQHVLNEIWMAYRALVEKEDLRFESVPPYQNYIRWIQHQDVREAEQFWREELTGFTAPTPLAMERKGGTESSGYGESFSYLSEEQTQSLQKWTRKHQLTLNTLMQGAWAYLLSRYSGESDVMFGVTSSGRPTELTGVENMVGLFINTLPARIRVPEQTQVVEWLRELQLKEIQRRQYEYTSLTEIQGWSEIPRGVSMFHTLYVFENYPVQAEGLDIGLELLQAKGVEQTNYPLNLSVLPGSQLAFKLMYDRSRFDEGTIQLLQNHLWQVLQQMTDRPNRKLSELDYVSEQERTQLLEEWNDTKAVYPREAVIPDLFEQQVTRTPDAVAVVYEDQQLTYRQLDEQANQLAHCLQKRGVGPDSLVGVCTERSPEMIISLLGVLKAGGAYVPLDPTYPEQRLQYILQDAGIEILVTWSGLEGWVPEDVDTLCLDRDRQAIRQESVTSPTPGVTAENLAYVIYTSGSTGQPKGNLTTHRNVVKTICNNGYLEVMERDRVLQLSNYAFDGSVFDIYSALLHGATLVLFPQEVVHNVEALAQRIQREEITVSFMTTALFNTLVDESLSCLTGMRKLLFGGERVSFKHVDKALEVLGEDRMIHVYGPTETTVFATHYAVDHRIRELGMVPIGRPIANTEVYVLDPNRQPVPIGVAGELYIGGDGLARSYLNRRELTEESFIPHPFSKQPGARLYRTGDRVKYLPDGNLEYLERMDHQVKIRGFRIELGEVERVLTAHSGVQEAVVLVREEEPGDKRLVAYVVGEGNPRQWWAHVRDQLPGYMVPTYFVPLESLPLTPNGKVDHKALEKCRLQGNQENTELANPRDDIEHELIHLWEDVLAVSGVGLHDDFFDLGGHSLLAVRLLTQIKNRWGKDIPASALFQHPTVEGLACVIRENTGAESILQIAVSLEQSEQAPFFCVHPAGGNVFCYTKLARQLRESYSFYGLQSPFLARIPAKKTTLEELTHLYVEEIKEIQPEGPYRVGGWSLGGVIAYQIALQLVKQGEEVDLLALMDTAVPGDVYQAEEDELIRQIGSIISKEERKKLQAMEQDDKYRYALEQAKAKGILPPDTDIDRFKQLAQTFYYNMKLVFDHSLEVYPKEMVYFQAEEGPDLSTDWRLLLQDKLKVYKVPGKHENMMDSPAVEVIAERLAMELKQTVMS